MTSLVGAPRIGIVGPLLGVNDGWVTSQGEILAERLRSDGFVVRTTSAVTGGVRRAVDTARTLARWDGQVDVIVVMVFSGRALAQADLATRRARRLGVPLILWLHGGNLPQFSETHPRWVRTVLQRATRVVAPSPYLTDTAVGLGLDACVVPNLLPFDDPPFVARRHLRPALLWMRTFHTLYRPELAVDVLDALVKTHPAARLTMAGQDDGRLELTKRLVHERGLGDQVRFAGFLDHAAKEQAFTEHDLFLNTTSVDNSPVSLLEAAAHGLPIVSTAVGGIPELFSSGTSALLVPSADGVELAASVRVLLDDPGTAARISQGGRAVAYRCSWAEVGPRWHRLLTEVVGP